MNSYSRRKWKMSKIREVLYEVLDPSECTIREAGEFYYHYNLMGADESLNEDYIRYEESQINCRNRVIGNAVKQGMFPRHPKTDTTIFGVSSLKNKAIIIVEF